MKGFWAMLTGRGGKEYREQHQAFEDAIPDRFPFLVSEDTVRIGPGDQSFRKATPEEQETLPRHPAYFENSLEAANYRRAHSCHGPMTKTTPLTASERRELMKDFRIAQKANRDLVFEQWLHENGIL